MATVMQLIAAEIAKPEYAALTDAQAAARLNSAREVRSYSRFGSFRTLANLLTEAEYNALRATLADAALGSLLIADMVRMLELPGDDKGNGGGIDFGTDAFREKVTTLCTAAGIADAATKIKAYAERLTSWPAANGFYMISPSDVRLARERVVG